MMLLHSSMAPQQILPAALTHIESSIQISQAELQLKKYHFFGSAAFEYYLPLELKCRDKGTFAKSIFLRGRVVRTVHSKLLRIININFGSHPPCITCWGSVLF